MGRISARITKSTTVKPTKKINKSPKVVKQPKNCAPYNTSIKPESCDCKS